MPNKEENEEYELIPHEELEAIKAEIRKAKEAGEQPKKLAALISDLSYKIDRLLAIFEDAMRAIKIEEGGLTFEERMRPIVERMNKILEQNSEIAAGIVAISDMIKEINEKLKPAALPPLPPLPPKAPPVPPVPPIPPPSKLPPIPPPPKRK